MGHRYWWRTPDGPSDTTARVLLDLSHLAVWSMSAPVAAFALVAGTVVGVHEGRFGTPVLVTAALKSLTVIVEIAGLPAQRGWNAGGWAYGSSGYATVAWFASVLVALS